MARNFELESKASVANNPVGEAKMLNTYDNFKVKKASLLVMIEFNKLGYCTITLKMALTWPGILIFTLINNI